MKVHILLLLLLLKHARALHPCLDLRSDIATGKQEVRCPSNTTVGPCRSAPPLRVDFLRLENDPRREMFIGSAKGLHTFPCFPLSDQDLWRSRRDVPGDESRMRS